jgi:hypothetical protein
MFRSERVLLPHEARRLVRRCSKVRTFILFLY